MGREWGRATFVCSEKQQTFQMPIQYTNLKFTPQLGVGNFGTWEEFEPNKIR